MYWSHGYLFLQPTVYFFKDGKKASAVVGADANQLSATMEELYK